MVIIPGWAATQLPHKLFHKLGNNNKTRVCFVKTGCKVEERLRFALKEKVEKCKNTIWKGRYKLGKNPNIPNPRIFPSAKNCFSPDEAQGTVPTGLGGWTIKKYTKLFGWPYISSNLQNENTSETTLRSERTMNEIPLKIGFLFYMVNGWIM